MMLARCWEAADGFPPEVEAILRSAGQTDMVGLEPLLIVPEYRIPLPGGSRASQTDVFVLARSATGLVTIAVEGKVDEAFGPTSTVMKATTYPPIPAQSLPAVG
jgi:Domain of unknown function (DUF6946)